MKSLIDSRVDLVSVESGCGSYNVYIKIPADDRVTEVAYFPKGVAGRNAANKFAKALGKLLKATVEEY